MYRISKQLRRIADNQEENSKYGTSELGKYIKKFPAISIPVITGALLFIGYLYKWGSLKYYGIGSSYIHFDISYLFPKSIYLFLFIMFYYIILIGFNKHIIERKNKKEKSYMEIELRCIYWFYMPLFGVSSFFLLLFKIYLILNILFIIFLFLLSLKLMYNGLKKKYYLPTLLILSLIGGLVAFSIGYIESYIRYKYEVIVGENDTLIVDYFNGTYILMEFQDELIEEKQPNSCKNKVYVKSIVNETLEFEPIELTSNIMYNKNLKSDFCNN